MKNQISEKHKRANRILSDPIVSQMDKIAEDIISVSLPKDIFIKGGQLVVRYSAKTTEALEKVRVAKSAYIKLNYPDIK